MQKKTIIVLLIVALFSLLIILGLKIFQQKQQASLREMAADAPDQAIDYTEQNDNVTLLCKLITSQIDKETIVLSDSVVILRTTKCFFQSKSGESTSVTVPLSFFNSKTNQFYLVNAPIDEIGMPSDGYIDNMLSFILNQIGVDPTVRLFADTDFSRGDAEFSTFFKDTVVVDGPKSWKKTFADTADENNLLTSSSGDKLFFASGITYVKKN